MRLALLLAAALLAGCHGRYKKAAPGLQSVEPHAVAPVVPTVELPFLPPGDPDEENVVEDVVEVGVAIGTAATASRVRGRLQRAMTTEAAAAAVAEGLLEGSRTAGLPYKVKEGGKHRLLVHIDDYGFTVASGAPAIFSNLRLEIRLANTGRRVYRSSRRCETRLGERLLPVDVVSGENALAAINALLELNRREMADLVSSHLRQCGMEAGLALGRHL